jgi:hemerythrin-like domain-containing protein
MCDYCDCRAQRELAGLSADHELLLILTRRIRKAAPSSLEFWRSELAASLLPHAEREERGVFAALRDSGVDPSYLDHFEDDHRRLHELLEAEATPERLAEMVELLEDHIQREETDLFPAARQLVPPEGWDAVEDAAMEVTR